MSKKKTYEVTLRATRPLTAVIEVEATSSDDAEQKARMEVHERPELWQADSIELDTVCTVAKKS